jgi:UDP-N-acetylglucosamine acyltransferase
LSVPRIDPSARVADGARLADDVEIGPFCLIGPRVELCAGVRLLSHVNVAGTTVIGERTTIYPFASLGTPPQSTGYRGGATRLEVGSDCMIREGVTMSTGTEKGGEITRVGDRCFLMANSHVAHDCQVGSDVTFANGAVLGGHVSLGNHVFVGGNCAVHQFVRVGEGAMLGGMSGITRDVIPFGFAFGPKADLVGLNMVGLKRRGHTRADMHRLRRAYRALFFGTAAFVERSQAVADELADDPLVGKIVAFIRDTGSRPLMMPAANGSALDAPTLP